MKPETALFLQKAQAFVQKAEELSNRNLWPEESGRTAYLAGFHAAQAILFEATNKVFKTHRGVQSEFARLVASDPSFDPELRPFLGQTYHLKAIADYDTGPGANVSRDQAVEAISAARLFLAAIEKLIAAVSRDGLE